MVDTDLKYMKLALTEARKGAGRTSPNPAVGALIVKDDRILSRGYHRRAGQPHAEVEALEKIGRSCPGATLYVTLEPCNHHGKDSPLHRVHSQSPNCESGCRRHGSESGRQRGRMQILSGKRS